MSLTVRILVAFIWALLGWLIVEPSAPAHAAPAHAELAYNYVSHNNAAVSTGTTTERGPPASHDHVTVYNAVDRWSHGNSARPDAASVGSTAAYATTFGFLHVPTASATPRVPAAVADVSLVVSDRGSVAAKTGSIAAAEARQVTVLGRYTGGVDGYVGKPGFNTLDLPFKGTGRWNWTRNKRFIDDAIERGDEIRLVTDPTAPLYRGGNTFQRELKYLQNRGYTWQQQGDYWNAVPR